MSERAKSVEDLLRLHHEHRDVAPRLLSAMPGVILTGVIVGRGPTSPADTVLYCTNGWRVAVGAAHQGNPPGTVLQFTATMPGPVSIGTQPEILILERFQFPRTPKIDQVLLPRRGMIEDGRELFALPRDSVGVYGVPIFADSDNGETAKNWAATITSDAGGMRAVHTNGDYSRHWWPRGNGMYRYKPRSDLKLGDVVEIGADYVVGEAASPVPYSNLPNRRTKTINRWYGVIREIADGHLLLERAGTIHHAFDMIHEWTEEGERQGKMALALQTLVELSPGEVRKVLDRLQRSIAGRGQRYDFDGGTS